MHSGTGETERRSGRRALRRGLAGRAALRGLPLSGPDAILFALRASPVGGALHALERPTAMANSRFKNGGPTRGRKRVKRIGMNSGKILKLGRQKKPRRGRDYTRL